jgi:hypothetical protein
MAPRMPSKHMCLFVLCGVQERGEAAAAQRLIDAAMSFLSPCACGDTEAASQGTQGDESEDDEGPAQKEKDPGTQEDPSTSQAVRWR